MDPDDYVGQVLRSFLLFGKAIVIIRVAIPRSRTAFPA